MRSFSPSALLALVVCPLLCSTALAAPIRVAVEKGATSTTTAADVAAQLNNDTFFDFTATVVAADGLDTAAELANYDVVLFGDSGFNDNGWTPAFAAAIKAAVNAGSLGVVSTGWADYAVRNAAPRDEDLDAVMPIDAYPDTSNHFCNTGSIVIGSTAHPVTAGVTGFSSTSSHIEISPFAPDATGGAVLGTATSSTCSNTTTNAVVVGQYGAGRTVYLGLLYMANANYNPADLRSGMADRLLEQAVQWAARRTVRVAVEQSAAITNGSGAAIVAQLNDDTYFDFNATLVTAADIDSATELSNYDVVVFGDTGSNNNDWTAAMAAALKTAVNQGTLGVVTSGWADYAIHSNIPRDADLDDVMPIDAYPNGNNVFCSGTGTITVTGPAHPITNGLTSFTTTSSNIEISPFAPDATNGVLLGTASATSCTSATPNAVVAGEYGAGRIVYLGLLYTGGSNYNVGDLRAGPADRLFEQAVNWAAPNTASPANQAPVANAQSVSLNENTSTAITLTGSDPDGDPLTFTVATQPGQGTLSGTAPNLTYTPNANYEGPDSFTFTVSDGTATSAPATVSITVLKVNVAPTANAQSVSLNENTSQAITLSGTDADGDALTFTIATQPTNGTLSGTAPNVTYTPATNYEGPDSFTFTVSDGTATSAPATVSITVLKVNVAPVADAQSASLAEDTTANVTLTGTDADGDALTYTVVGQPANGALTGTAPNLTYVPAANFNGSDAFTFTVSDGTATSSPATVSLTITAVNDAPLAMADTLTVAEDASGTLTLTGGDIDGDAVTFTVASQPTNGTLSGTAPNLTYTPNANYNGTDSFTFTATDGSLTSAPATIDITVTPVNDAPTATAMMVTLDQGTTATFTLQGNDPDGDTLTFTVASGPTSGTLSGTEPNLSYAPNTAFHGADALTFTASDGTVTSAPETVSITVNNLPPVLSIMADKMMPGVGETVQFTALLVDPGGDTTTLDWTFGDGATGTGLSPTHVFTQAGEVTVTATASDGVLTTQQTLMLQVQSTAPVISGIQGPDMGTEGASLTYSADATSPSTMLTYAWDFGDGSAAGSGQTVAHAWPDNGTYTLTLTITDDLGQSSTSTRTITIENVKPSAQTVGAHKATVGTPFTLQLSATDPAGSNDPLTWTLVSGPGAVSAEGQYTFTPTAEQVGRQMIVAQVSDGDEGVLDVPFAVDVESETGTVDAGGCGCSANGASFGGMWLLAGALALLRRRKAHTAA